MDSYKKIEIENQLKQISIICFLTAFLYLMLAVNDFLYAPDELKILMLIVHSIIMPSILFSLSLLAYFKKNLSFMSFLLFSAPIIAAFLNIYIISHYQTSTIYTSEIYLIIFWIFAVSGMPLKHMIGSSTIIIFTATLISLYSTPNASDEFALHTIFMLISFSLGITGAILLKQSQTKLHKQYQQQSLELQNRHILLKELFHRVKNNLQMVSGILYMQSKKIKDKQTLQIFKNSIQTIKSMGMIHEKLYKSKNLASINFNEYVNDLISYIKQGLEEQNISFTTECEEISLSLDQAVPLGLITNEILTNSIKYAFKDNSKENMIKIKFFLDAHDSINLLISDNGRGIDFDNFDKNFGYDLIYSLATQQLQGSYECFNNDGLNYLIKIDNKEKK